MERRIAVIPWVLIAATVGGLVSKASADWEVVLLAPLETVHTRVNSIGGFGGAQQAGMFGHPAGNIRVGFWSGTAGSWVDLTPAMYGLWIADTDGFYQAGRGTVSGVPRALLWNGTIGSMVDLNPSGSTNSSANGVRGHVQVGRARFGGVDQAGIWAGTADSFLSLHQAGWSASEVVATDGTQHVGRVTISDRVPALWSGPAPSFVNLLPAGASRGEALGVSGGVQAGWASFRYTHAVMWRGSAESFVDLNPSWSIQSLALDVSGDEATGVVIAGTVYGGASPRAVVWEAESGVMSDLHSLLDADEFLSSEATTVHRDETGTYVGGIARKRIDSGWQSHAIMWRERNRPQCPADFNGDGFLDFFDYGDFVTCFEGGACPVGRTADFNGDATVDFFDYTSFVTTFDSGC